jgi:preprotein translocase subunit SecF
MAVFFLLHRGLHLSVEFTGGTVMEVAYQQSADIGKVREAIGKLGYPDVQVQSYGTSRDVQIRLPAQKGMSSDQQSAQVMQALKSVDAVGHAARHRGRRGRRWATSSPPTA